MNNLDDLHRYAVRELLHTAALLTLLLILVEGVTWVTDGRPSLLALLGGVAPLICVHYAIRIHRARRKQQQIGGR